MDKAASHFEYFVDNVENAIAKFEGKIPNNFPPFIAEAIFSGLRKQAAKKLL